jgi:hypothetical protein
VDLRHDDHAAHAGVLEESLEPAGRVDNGDHRVLHSKNGSTPGGKLERCLRVAFGDQGMKTGRIVSNKYEWRRSQLTRQPRKMCPPVLR